MLRLENTLSLKERDCPSVGWNLQAPSADMEPNSTQVDLRGGLTFLGVISVSTLKELLGEEWSKQPIL